MPVYWEQRNYLAKACEYSSLEQTLFSFQDVSPAFLTGVTLLMWWFPPLTKEPSTFQAGAGAVLQGV